MGRGTRVGGSQDVEVLSNLYMNGILPVIEKGDVFKLTLKYENEGVSEGVNEGVNEPLN